MNYTTTHRQPRKQISLFLTTDNNVSNKRGSAGFRNGKQNCADWPESQNNTPEMIIADNNELDDERRQATGLPEIEIYNYKTKNKIRANRQINKQEDRSQNGIKGG